MAGGDCRSVLHRVLHLYLELRGQRDITFQHLLNNRTNAKHSQNLLKTTNCYLHIIREYWDRGVAWFSAHTLL